MAHSFLKKEYLRQIKPVTNRQKNLKRTLSMPNVQFLLFGGVLMLIFFGGLTGIVPRDIISTIFKVMMYSIMAIGFCMLLGYAGLASLGTAGFVGIGIYSVFFAMERWGLTLGIGVLIAILAAIAVGIVVGFISLRIEGIYLAIITLGVSEILVSVFKAIASSLSLSKMHRTLFFLKLGVTQMQSTIFVICLITLVGLMCLSANLFKSPIGRAMLAMKNSTSAAQAMGISLLKYRLLAFVISVVFAAVSGVMFFAYYGSFQTTSSLLTISTSLNILGAVIIGGATSLWGAVLGVVLIYGINDILGSYVPFFRQNGDYITIVSGILIILIVMFYAGGLKQLVTSIRYKQTVKKMQRKLLNNEN